MLQIPSLLHHQMCFSPLYLLCKSAFFLYFLCVVDGMLLSLVLSLSCWASCHNLWFLADGCSECFPEWNFHSGGSKAATFHRQPASWCNKYFYPYTCSVFLYHYYYYYCFYYCGVWVCVHKCMKLTFSQFTHLTFHSFLQSLNSSLTFFHIVTFKMGVLKPPSPF